MTKKLHNVVYRKNYTVPDYSVNMIDLTFELGDEKTIVISKMFINAEYSKSGEVRPLILHGKDIKLLELFLDGKSVPVDSYNLTDDSLTILYPPHSFKLEIKTEIHPENNTSLEGLYRSTGGMFCTQCEAEGFRKITYYMDRPDILTLFTTTIIANKNKYPILLSNGNLQNSGELSNGRHFATWNDPFKKPSYLFATVAGNLVCIEDTFTTCSGRNITLKIYVHEQNHNKCDHAMRSLKKAMRWDEEKYGREYDLDIFMIVAVDDFNMGAMENKGLNIFNSCYVLATPESATDDDYNAIEEVIAHEYFHNWSGNRVTCRDWFQLSLKEGLTVFRDQEFSSDMQSRGVKRIEDVRNLRTSQFAEDGGPMAHPVRPDSYIEINNFYTSTVYNKGAELVRMQQTILGKERFRRGMDTYFERFDGQAVTVDDFIQTMAEAGGINLEQFSLWYAQSGTPQIEVKSSYNSLNKTYTLAFTQSCQSTPGQIQKLPLHIPIQVGLLNQNGEELPLNLAGEIDKTEKSKILNLHNQNDSFCFTNIDKEPIPALLRNFSAPVKLIYSYRHEQLATLMAHETDPFARWEAGQNMAVNVILDLVLDIQQGRALILDTTFADAFYKTIICYQPDSSFLAETLTLPSEKYLAELVDIIDPEAIHNARQFVIKKLTILFKEEFYKLRASNLSNIPFTSDDGRSGSRRLANLCLSYLMSTPDQNIIDICCEQYKSSDNMTDSIAALNSLVSVDCKERVTLLEDFYKRWSNNRLVVDKWFSLQAQSSLPTVFDELEKLLAHPAFEITNPNRFRSLVGAFCQRNLVNFHAQNGDGYRFLTEQLLRLIPINPQVSARMLGPLTTWQRFEPIRREKMRQQLQRFQNIENLPRDVYEVVSKSLE